MSKVGLKKRGVMITSRHRYRDPVNKHCFRPCVSCFRCANKGMKIECDSCSGRPDPTGERIPHTDDFCDCRNGVMRWMTKDGRLVVRRFMSNPFKGTVKTDAVTSDESDWNAYLYERREQIDNPEWDPIIVTEE